MSIIIKNDKQGISINYVSFFVNSSYGVDECGSACTSPNVTSLATLSNCTLTFLSATVGAWYAMALQVNNTSV